MPFVLRLTALAWWAKPARAARMALVMRILIITRLPWVMVGRRFTRLRTRITVIRAIRRRTMMIRGGVVRQRNSTAGQRHGAVDESGYGESSNGQAMENVAVVGRVQVMAVPVQSQHHHSL